MKNTRFFLLLFVSIAALLAGPALATHPDSPTDASLADALNSTIDPSSEPAWMSQAYCSAECDYGPDVSCTGTSCSAQDDPNGFVVCDGVQTNCPVPLSVSISVLSCEQTGDRSSYELRATASGGNGVYDFDWLHESWQHSADSANPNFANATDTRSKTVYVTVESGSDDETDSIFLANPCLGP